MERNNILEFNIDPQPFANGRYAVVKSSNKRCNQARLYSLKFFGEPQMPKPEDDWILREAEYLKVVSNLRGTVQIVAVFNNDTNKRIRYPVIAMERLTGGSLEALLVSLQSRRESLNEEQARIIFRNTVIALHEVHVHKKLIHCNLKPLNVYFTTADGTFPTKLVDFGFSVALYERDEHYSYHSGTANVDFTVDYWAPEQVDEFGLSNGMVFSRKTDIWQVGCILFQMLNENNTPFGEDFLKIKSGTVDFVNPRLSENAKDLMRKILQLDPTRRLTTTDILNHPWLNLAGTEQVIDVPQTRPMGFEDFNDLSYLCYGGFGIVMNAVDKQDDSNVVVMKFFGYTASTQSFTSTDSDSQWILREIHTLQTLKAAGVEGVPQLITTFNDTQEGLLVRRNTSGIVKPRRRIYPVIVMEKLSGGDLFDGIKARKKFSEQDASVIFGNLIRALNEIHLKTDLAVVDLKTENVVFVEKESLKVKIIDLGLAIPLFGRDEHYDSRILGTKQFLAPETLRKHPTEYLYSRQSDVWQAGVVLYVMLTGTRLPFARSEFESIQQVYDRIKQGDYLKGPAFTALSAGARDLIQRILTVHPQSRMTGPEILDHPWILERADLPDSDLGADYRRNLRDWSNFRSFKDLLGKYKNIFTLSVAGDVRDAISPRSHDSKVSCGEAATESEGLSSDIADLRRLREAYCEKIKQAIQGANPEAKIGSEQDDGIHAKAGGDAGGAMGCTDVKAAVSLEVLLSHPGVDKDAFCEILKDPIHTETLSDERYEEAFALFNAEGTGRVSYQDFFFKFCALCPQNTLEYEARLYFEVFNVTGSHPDTDTISADALTAVMRSLFPGDYEQPSFLVGSGNIVSFKQFFRFYTQTLEASIKSQASHHLDDETVLAHATSGAIGSTAAVATVGGGGGGGGGVGGAATVICGNCDVSNPLVATVSCAKCEHCYCSNCDAEVHAFKALNGHERLPVTTTPPAPLTP